MFDDLGPLVYGLVSVVVLLLFVIACMVCGVAFFSALPWALLIMIAAYSALKACLG